MLCVKNGDGTNGYLIHVKFEQLLPLCHPLYLGSRLVQVPLVLMVSNSIHSFITMFVHKEKCKVSQVSMYNVCVCVYVYVFVF